MASWLGRWFPYRAVRSGFETWPGHCWWAKYFTPGMVASCYGNISDFAYTIMPMPNKVNTVSNDKSMITASSNKMRNIPFTWLLTSSASRYWGLGSAITRPKEMKKKIRHFIFLQRNVTEISFILLEYQYKSCNLIGLAIVKYLI